MESIGIGLLIIGPVLFFIGVKCARTTRRVSADRGSVAIGGNNHSPITIANQGMASGANTLFWTVWNSITGFATLLGLALILWPGK